MRLRPGHVVRLFDEAVRPEAVKRHICINPERRLFLRINSQPYWPPHFLLKADLCTGLIEHDSYVELTNLHRQPAIALQRDLERFGNPLGLLSPSVGYALALAAREADTLTDDQKATVWHGLVR